jgi:hypothetical protein
MMLLRAGHGTNNNKKKMERVAKAAQCNVCCTANKTL